MITVHSVTQEREAILQDRRSIATSKMQPKNLPEKKSPNDNHPTKFEERFLEVAKKRGFYSWVKEPQERTARRAEVQRRTALKRRGQDLIKVQTAFEALKYDSTFCCIDRS